MSMSWLLLGAVIGCAVGTLTTLGIFFIIIEFGNGR